MIRPLLFVVILQTALVLPAQVEGTPRPEPVQVSDWSAPRSRALFSSLDADGDDRLDLLEAAGLRTLAGPADFDSFRRLDSNRDGHLDWREFDAHFRDLLAHGQVLRLLPARPELVPEEPEPPPSDPTGGLVAAFDRSADGELDRTELQAMLRQTGAPAAMISHFDRLDGDGSGTISPEEFVPFAGLLPAVTLPGLTATPAEAALRHGALAYDLDQSGFVDPSELGRFLWRLDPSLLHWDDVILDGADRDGNGALDADEITRSLMRGAPPPASERSRL